jgi:hypothetical protein
MSLIQFPSLATGDSELQEDVLSLYVEHLKHFYSDMHVQFSDLLDMNIVFLLFFPHLIRMYMVSVAGLICCQKQVTVLML